MASLRELGDQALARGDLEGAEARFRRALQVNPEATSPRIGLARVATARNDLAEVERLANEVMTRVPEHPDALVMLARVDLAKGERVAARERLEKALRAEPRHFEAHAELAELTGTAPRRPGLDAAEAFRLAAAHPYDPWARVQAARALLSQGRDEQARATLADHPWFSDLDPASGMAAFTLLRQLDARWTNQRFVPVHCYADETLRAKPYWPMRLRVLWASLSASLDPVLQTTFVPISFAPFSSKSADDTLAAIDAAFVESARGLPLGGIVAAFTERQPPRRRGSWRLGQAEYLGRRLLVRLEPDRMESRTLIHEVLHLYGGVHISPELDSIMNPTGTSVELDPANRKIVEILRERGFARGGVQRDVLARVDPAALTGALAQALNLNLAFRRLGVLEALEAKESSRFLAAREARKALALDPELAQVAGFTALLLAEQRRFASAARFMEAAAGLYGTHSAEGRAAQARARALLDQARLTYGDTDDR